MKWHVSREVWARWRWLAGVVLLSLGAPPTARATARRPPAAHGSHRKLAHRAVAGGPQHRKVKHPAHPIHGTEAHSTLAPPVRPPRRHPALDLAYQWSGKPVPGR
jgi:hypothetical protein